MKENVVFLGGRRQFTVPLSAAINNSAKLEGGIYDCWSDVDCYITTNRETPNPPLTTATGYRLPAGNQIPVGVSQDDQFFVIAAGAGTFSYHRVQ